MTNPRGYLNLKANQPTKGNIMKKLKVNFKQFPAGDYLASHIEPAANGGKCEYEMEVPKNAKFVELQDGSHGLEVNGRCYMHIDKMLNFEKTGFVSQSFFGDDNEDESCVIVCKLHEIF